MLTVNQFGDSVARIHEKEERFRVSAVKEVNWFNYHSAGILAKRIQKFWHKLGHTNVHVERFSIFENGELYGVRSNLVNGLPPKVA